MRPDNVKIVARREYLERVKTKGFWIGTVVFPLFFVAMAVLPTLFMARARTTHEVVVVDSTGRVASELRVERPRPRRSTGPLSEEQAERRASPLKFLIEEPRKDRAAQDADLNRRVLAKEVDAWLRIGPEVIAGEPIEYHGRSTSNFMTQERLERRLSEAVRRVRLADAGFDPDKVGDLSAPVDLRTIKVSETGSRAEGGAAGFLLAYILFFMLFLGIIIWGTQVMNGVLEEKGTRVVEVLVSSIKPIELMMGKLLGICLVGLTQFAVWMATLVVMTAPAAVGFLSSRIGAMPSGFDLPSLSPLAAIHFLLFFVLGFLIYASFYAALGAAFNNIQEAQQIAGTLSILFTVPAVLMPMTINDPSSTTSLVGSLIPLFTPVLMPLRIVVETPPAWQILLGYALSVAFLFLMVWLCGRIYRVGILMYGKKPTIPELVRWLRYS